MLFANGLWNSPLKSCSQIFINFYVKFSLSCLVHKDVPINIHHSGCVDWLHKSYYVTSAFFWLIYVNSKYKKTGKFQMLKLNVELRNSMWEISFFLANMYWKRHNRIFKIIYVIWSTLLGISIGCVLSFLWDFENQFEYLWEGIYNTWIWKEASDIFLSISPWKIHLEKRLRLKFKRTGKL